MTLLDDYLLRTFPRRAGYYATQRNAAGRAILGLAGDDMIIEQMTRAMHDEYERRAPDFGWKTQDASAVAWDDLPAANRDLMLVSVRAALRVLGEPR